MSIASNATDKQVGEILEAIQDITPEVVEQAVAYYQVMNSVWLGIFLGTVVFSVVIFCWNLSMLRKTYWLDNGGYAITVALSICVIVICLVGSVACIHDLVKLSIAPDYYAAECMARLLGR